MTTIDEFSPSSSPISKLQFKFPFRKYQGLILSFFEEHRSKDTKFHIVAPPGSGKTIVGIELIKRIQENAVIFAPTSTIQMQWKEKIGLFLAYQEQHHLDDIATMSPTSLKPINIFTYQLLSTPGDNKQFIEELAKIEWENELYKDNIVDSIVAAKKRIDTLKKNNPTKYRRDLQKHYKRAKDKLLQDPTFDANQVLHKNAQKLIDDLVANNTKIIILDEAHHLLDYWAFILKQLIKRIDNPIIIGLTATPPLDADEVGMENYLELLGDVDFEIPTPAVVKEGNLAPYQDLVFVVRPTDKERVYIQKLQNHFDSTILKIAENVEFNQYLYNRLFVRKKTIIKKISNQVKDNQNTLGLSRAESQDLNKQSTIETEEIVTSWNDFFRKNTYLAIAGCKYAIRKGLTIPYDVKIIEEMEKEMIADDWLILLSDFLLNYLALSESSENHKLYAEISNVLKDFGLTVTERGIRAIKSPADKILSLSDNKNIAVVEILKQEFSNLGYNLRAVVISDFENESAVSAKYLQEGLEKDSGSAIRTYRRVVQDEVTTKLEPVLVTGKRVLVDEHHVEQFKKKTDEWKKLNNLDFELQFIKSEFTGITEIKGTGKDWKSQTYVRMMTALFEVGVFNCIVGTRGLLAEGWDALSLNTLIDLTTATTSMMVQQIRGRSIRLDPKSPNKVANNWDVVCVEPKFEKGDQDLKRFVKKHSRFYGINEGGRISKSVSHVDTKLHMSLYDSNFKFIDYKSLNQRMLARSKKRELIYKEWEIGKPYKNFEYSVTKLDKRDIKFKTAYTMRDTLKALFRTILLSIVSILFFELYIVAQLGAYSVTPYGITVLSILFFILLGFTSTVSIVKYFKKAFVELPLDSFLLDIGKVVIQALRSAGFVNPALSEHNVEVIVDEMGYYDLKLNYAGSEETKIFSKCIDELFSRVSDQRYLISRSELDIKLGFYTPLWLILRTVIGWFTRQQSVAYHPLPSIFSTHRKYAKLFAREWHKYVGGGKLIYTRSQKGVDILLKLRRNISQRYRRIKMDYWG